MPSTAVRIVALELLEILRYTFRWLAFHFALRCFAKLLHLHFSDRLHFRSIASEVSSDRSHDCLHIQRLVQRVPRAALRMPFDITLKGNLMSELSAVNATSARGPALSQASLRAGRTYPNMLLGPRVERFR